MHREQAALFLRIEPILGERIQIRYCPLKRVFVEKNYIFFWFWCYVIKIQGLFPEIFEMFFKYLVPVNCSLVLSTLYYHGWDQPVSGSINFYYLCTHDLYSPMHNVF